MRFDSVDIAILDRMPVIATFVGIADHEPEAVRRSLCTGDVAATVNDDGSFELRTVDIERAPGGPLEAVRRLHVWSIRQLGDDCIERVTITFGEPVELESYARPEPAPAPAVAVEPVELEPAAAPAPLDLVGISEIAEMFGVSRQRASTMAKEDDAPAPAQRLQAGPVWHRSDWQLILDRRRRR